MTRLLGALALIFWASAVLWHLTLGQTLAQRIPPGWSWTSEYVGEVNYPDPQTGKLPERNQLGFYQRAMTVLSESRPYSVVVQDQYKIVDPVTSKTEWDYSVDFEVDPASGRHLDPEYASDYVVLPQKLDKDAVYNFRNSYIKGIPLQFIREDFLEGLEVFLFAYEGRGEYTESYAGSEEYEGVDVPPGHEIKCANDHFRYAVWAEPITGEALKIKESCRSGDYIFNIATGEAVEPVLRWSAETAGLDVIRRAEFARERIFELRLARYLPLGLGGLGLVFAAAAAIRIRSRRS